MVSNSPCMQSENWQRYSIYKFPPQGQIFFIKIPTLGLTLLNFLPLGHYIYTCQILQKIFKYNTVYGNAWLVNCALKCTDLSHISKKSPGDDAPGPPYKCFMPTVLTLFIVQEMLSLLQDSYFLLQRFLFLTTLFIQWVIWPSHAQREKQTLSSNNPLIYCLPPNLITVYVVRLQ